MGNVGTEGETTLARQCEASAGQSRSSKNFRSCSLGILIWPNRQDSVRDVYIEEYCQMCWHFECTDVHLIVGNGWLVDPVAGTSLVLHSVSEKFNRILRGNFSSPRTWSSCDGVLYKDDVTVK